MSKIVLFLITKSRAGKSGWQDTHRASQAGWQGEDDVDLQLNLKCKAINAWVLNFSSQDLGLGDLGDVFFCLFH